MATCNLNYIQDTFFLGIVWFEQIKNSFGKRWKLLLFWLWNVQTALYSKV